MEAYALETILEDCSIVPENPHTIFELAQQCDTLSWGKYPSTQRKCRTTREMISRWLVVLLVHIQDMFPVELRDARRARIASLPVDLQMKYRKYQGWANFPYEQPAMSAAQIASNDELAMIVLPQSIIMSPSMPKLYKRETDAHLVHVPTAMPTCIHHAFGKGNKHSLHQHKNIIAYPTFSEILGGSDTYLCAHEETHIRKKQR